MQIVFKNKRKEIKDLITTYKGDERFTQAITDNFLRYLPKRFEESIELHEGKDEKTLAHCVDMVDFHYRKYLSGIHLTLHTVFCEVRILMNCRLYRPDIIPTVLLNAENVVLSNELYELMMRHDTAKVKILKLIAS